jgi:hypothetical protein
MIYLASKCSCSSSFSSTYFKQSSTMEIISFISWFYHCCTKWWWRFQYRKKSQISYGTFISISFQRIRYSIDSMISERRAQTYFFFFIILNFSLVETMQRLLPEKSISLMVYLHANNRSLIVEIDREVLESITK